MKYWAIVTFSFLINLLIGQTRGLYLSDSKGTLYQVEEEKRVALLIGNERYQHDWQGLEAPIADVQLIRQALEKNGFEVMQLLNGNRIEILNAIGDFQRKISKNTVALFYYAGHGVEVESKNYVIPVDDKPKCREDIITNGVSVDFIHDKMKNAGSSFNIVILDACRNQPLPFKCENARSGPNRPNMVEFRPNGSLIAFSTSPGNTALDKKNGEKNSPYALALANAINTPNLKIEDVFKKVSREMEQSGQRPWSNNAFTGDFYFNKIIDNLNINDADSDGVIDRFDKCPNDPGPLTNEGCPSSLTIEESTEVSSPSKSALLELLIPIEAGQFTFGCTGNYCEKNELPNQVIKLAKFSISRYEVTNEQFANFLNEYQSNIVKEGKNKSKLMIDPKNSGGLALVKGKWIVRKGFENRAVINVTWFGAKTFCDFYGFDLPTEAQWEYASKDGRKDSKNRFAGVDFPTKLKDYAVYADNSSNEIAQVGAKFPTMLNIHDLSGNVKEWCLDWYSSKPQVFSENFEPEQNLKSIRGGSFFSVENDCRVTRRFFMTPERFDNEVGFRIVKNY